jgi:hypothetical protein
MFLRRPAIVASILALALSSACTTTSQGEPRPATTTDTSTSNTSDNGEELPFAGAPKVDNPLDTSRYEQDPCLSLAEDQARGLNLPPTGETSDDVVLGNGCEWRNKETRGFAQIVFLVDDPRGLSPEYKASKEGKWAYFEELPDIEGYPAIARSGTDDRDIGHCSVLVGVADDMVFVAVAQLSQANIGQKDPCEVATQVAGLALQTMKRGA